MEDNGEINFDSVILTPLERWVETDLDLEPDVVEYLNQLAKESNQSVDNVMNHILFDFMSEHLELSELNADTLQQSGEKSPCILIMEKGDPIAKVKMLRWGKKNHVLASGKNPPKHMFESKLTEPVTNCDHLMQESAAFPQIG